MASSSALAHRGGHDALKVRDDGAAIHCETLLDPASLTSIDKNKDGVISRVELAAGEQELATWIDAHLRVIGQDGAALSPVFRDAPIVDDAHHDGASSNAPVRRVRILRRYEASGDAAFLAVDLPGLEDHPFIISGPAGRVTGRIGAGPQFLTIRGERDDQGPE
ncbi:MAG: hypothetical protein AAF224_00755 [Pseudomonadota bacterium]